MKDLLKERLEKAYESDMCLMYIMMDVGEVKRILDMMDSEENPERVQEKLLDAHEQGKKIGYEEGHDDGYERGYIDAVKDVIKRMRRSSYGGDQSKKRAAGVPVHHEK